MSKKTYPHLSRARIGVLTSSGKVYLALVRELARRRIDYVSLLPGQPIPLDVKIVITTRKEESGIQEREIIVFEDDSNPRKTIDEALLMLLGKTRFRELVIGIDPGKLTGLAVLGDGLILETGTYTETKNLIDELEQILISFPSERIIVKIGQGAEKYGSVLMTSFASKFPSVEIQIIEEAGTTNGNIPIEEAIPRNIASAIRIALRRGKSPRLGG